MTQTKPHVLWIPAAIATIVLTLATPGFSEKLTDNGRGKRDLVFLDAKTLVFVEQVSPRQLAIMTLNIETGASKPLHPDMRNNEFEPCFAPDRKHYAFVQNVGNLNLRLVIRNAST